MSYAAAYAPARTAAALSPRPAAMRPAGVPTPSSRGAAVGYASTAARYREAELASATPGQLIVMLFDKCVLTVRHAEQAFAAGDVAGRVDHVCKAVDMVTELRGSLDFAAGGEISVQLDALYAFVLRELFAANREQDPGKLVPVLRVMGELREAFAGAQAQLAAQGAAPASSGGRAA